MNLTQLLDPVVTIAKQAGDKILDIYHDHEGSYNIERKADKSPVTEADMRAHHHIVAELAKLTPNIPVLSEESDKISYADRQSWQRYWLVDPLDGTEEFIQQTGEFTVNIAFIQDHVSRLGVVYAPVSKTCYFAIRGQGAFKQYADAEKQTIQSRSVASQRMMRIVASRRKGKRCAREMFAQVEAAEIVRMGSSLKFCLVAEGSADIYPRLGPTSEWDTAAAQCVVEEAGGKVMDTQGQALTYNTKDSLLNPHFLVVGDVTHDWLQYLAN